MKMKTLLRVKLIWGEGEGERSIWGRNFGVCDCGGCCWWCNRGIRDLGWRENGVEDLQ